MKTGRFLMVLIVLFSASTLSSGQTITVGDGSYTTQFPGTDAAGRNSYPSGSPQLSGNALGKAVPTNDWWSKLIKEDHAANLFNYPLALQTRNDGLVVSYIPWGVYGDQEPILVAVKSLNAGKATVADYSDWLVSIDWQNGNHHFQCTAGIGMPFLYFNKASEDIAEVTVNSGSVSILNETLLIVDAASGADFVVYAPAGSQWEKNGKVYTSTLNGKNYWSMAMLPLSNPDPVSNAESYKKYAYVFPRDSKSTWHYDEESSVLRTDFNVETEVKEGSHNKVLLGLLPHQWANLADDSPQPGGDSYPSVRGELKTLEGNSFSVENTFKGILPTLPYLSNYSEGFDPAELENKIRQIENDALATWTDSYNEGQVMNRLIQTARIAHESGNSQARDKMLATVKERLEDWLTYESGEVAFLFYYNATWSAMLGYPAGHGQDSNINDHHFHWGYFIHAAAFVQQFDPTWAEKWGGMIDLLIRDAASQDRNDPLFPFLRNFSPYAGHCWANGFATFPQGNDQESTSESMQFNSALIHWGSITANDEIRDLGIYLYTTEQTAIEEYWFDIYERNFKAGQIYSLVSRVWGNSYDNGTFWTADIAASYGIEMYPIHGGSLYLGHHQNYAEKLWNEIKSNTGILANEENPNLWHDVMWKYLSFTDPAAAIELYDSYPDRNLKFGISDAQTYYWLHSMNALGQVNVDITANHPIAAVFQKDDELIYVAHNYSESPLTVSFSDGYQLYVPAHRLVTSKDVTVSGILSSDFTQAYVNGSVNLFLQSDGPGITKVEFFDGSDSIGEIAQGPFNFKAENLSPGMHYFYARIYSGEQFNVSNTLAVQVGEQIPYKGYAFELPGTIEAGDFDKYEGGRGQNISYFDSSPGNFGNYRSEEYVDASSDETEGKVIGWITAGEWTEYSIHVLESGLYSLDFRFASGNAAGGGPFSLWVDGQNVSGEIHVPSTSNNSWDIWAPKTVKDIPLIKGEQVLRLDFASGEFNLGRMTFSKTGEVPYSFPIASAGENIKVLWPEDSAMLDASASSESSGLPLSYKWSQVYGPSVVDFIDETLEKPEISGLVEGVYRFNLEVYNPDLRSSSDDVLVIVSSTENIVPSVSITLPENNSFFPEGVEITIAALAKDLDGSIEQVDFYQNDTLIATDTTFPYSVLWTAAQGEYSLVAKATDNGGATGISSPVLLSFVPVYSCVETSSEAQQGQFEEGYQFVFETVGTDVTISCELYDEKNGVIAYLWTRDPFSEKSMQHVEGKRFSTVISGQLPGSALEVACKFAFEGGLAVTKYFTYIVGDDCELDLEKPTDFSATIGEITESSIELLLQANDNSGLLMYQINYDAVTETSSSESATLTSHYLTGLKPETNYVIFVSASDPSGNVSLNSPLMLEATTLESMNTDCKGQSSEASQGSFSIGYKYDFSTEGRQVDIAFELLDDKDGVFAYLWNTSSGFEETPMTDHNGVFKISLMDQVPGNVLKLSCKFAFPGGLAVTKTFDYTVGDNCDSSSAENTEQYLEAPYPNPVSDILNVELPDEKNTIRLFDIQGNEMDFIEVQAKTFVYDVSSLPGGIYLLLINEQFSSVIVKK
jgi:endo-1,3(4)-beta-glucanase